MRISLESPALDMDPRVLLQGVKKFNPLEDLPRYKAKYPQAIQLMKIGRIYPSDISPGVNYYTGESDPEIYANIGEHCLAVARVCEVLGSILLNARVITADQFSVAVERGLVHDAGKAVEVMRRKANRDNPAAAYTTSAYETLKPILVTQGIHPELVDYMARAGTETGHGSKKDFIYQDPKGIVRLKRSMWVQKIVHLADDMTSSSLPTDEKPETETHFVTPLKKMQESNFQNRYPWMWVKGLGFDSTGRVTEVKDVNNPPEGFTNVGTYAAYQVFVSHSIARQFAQYLSPEVLIEYYVNNSIS